MSSFGHLDDDALAGAILAAGTQVRWPATPDVAPAVEREIAAARPRPWIGFTWPALPRRRRLVLLVVAVLLLLGGAALAAKLVVEIGAVTIETAPGLPTALPSATELGTPVTLEEAADLTGITPRYPRALGPPDEVWTDEGVVGFDPDDTASWVAMSWDAGPGLPPLGDTDRGAVLIQFHGQAETAVKTVYEESGSIRFVRIGGVEAAWVTGPHELRLVAGGVLRTLRVEGNVLLWQEGADTFRFESSLPLARARSIAESGSS